MSDEQLFIIGTAQDRENAARERGVDPRSIRLVRRQEDLLGHRGGRLLLGHGAHLINDWPDLVRLARLHGIHTPGDG